MVDSIEELNDGFDELALKAHPEVAKDSQTHNKLTIGGKVLRRKDWSFSFGTLAGHVNKQRPSGRPKEESRPPTGKIPVTHPLSTFNNYMVNPLLCITPVLHCQQPAKKAKTVLKNCAPCGGTGHNRARCV